MIKKVFLANLTLACFSMIVIPASAQNTSVKSQQSNAAQAYFDKANVYYKEGKYQEAIEPYKQGISLNPDYVTAYAYLGNAYNKLGQYEEAIKVLSKALQMQPDNAYGGPILVMRTRI